ncbi:hypothetical protein R3P38DRAFT_3196541 [Favolaschia claudopus]|uniref:Uncharacterized protein n=1 Tax=Favolaschia claudopus TaxID=2862362 RepID=A0AAW0B7A2_9AGAR
MESTMIIAIQKIMECDMKIVAPCWSKKSPENAADDLHVSCLPPPPSPLTPPTLLVVVVVVVVAVAVASPFLQCIQASSYNFKDAMYSHHTTSNDFSGILGHDTSLPRYLPPPTTIFFKTQFILTTTTEEVTAALANEVPLKVSGPLSTTLYVMPSLSLGNAPML